MFLFAQSSVRLAVLLAVLLTAASLAACTPDTHETTGPVSETVLTEPTETQAGEGMYGSLAQAPDVMLLDQATALERVQFGAAEDEQAVLDGLTALNQRLLPYLAEQEAGRSLAFSSSGLYMALALMMEGSAGESRDELLAFLGLSGVGAETRSKLLEDLIASLNLEAGGPGVGELPLALRSSQAIWIQAPYEVDQAFADRAAGTYQADVFLWKPSEHAKAHTALIQWYSDKTLGLVLPVAVPAAAPSLRNALILLNALYLKANWVMPFDDELTEFMSFILDEGSPAAGPDGSTIPAPEGTTVNVQTMTLRKDGQALVREDYTIASLPMSFGYEVYFALPAEAVTVDSLLGDEAFFKDFTKFSESRTLEHYSINWLVPRLDLTVNVDLTQASTDLGAPLIRDPRVADLSGMLAGAEDVDLIVSEIRQDARFILDEAGIEAAAVTLIGDETATPEPLPSLDFHLNRPFLLEIRSPEGIALLTALVRNPST